MKIERINDNQIRFVFQAQDLAARDISINDILTRSSDKAQGLFQEITAILNNEYAFSTVGMPLAFEATMSHDVLSILVTRMDMNGGDGLQGMMGNFMSQFSKGMSGETGMPMPHNMSPNGVPPIQNNSKNPQVQAQSPMPESGYALFSFENLDTLTAAVARINTGYKGKSHVYKMNNRYYLLLQNTGKAEHSTKKLEGLLLEFGQREISGAMAYSQMLEHGEIIIAENAISKLKTYHQYES